MEDYDQFVQHCSSHLRKSEEEDNKTPPASSLIRFYGRPILPPLREEMHRHRDAAQKATVHRKMKDDLRMAYVQTILHSVQLRKTPTLQELLQESEIKQKSSHSGNTTVGSGMQSTLFIGTKESLSPSLLSGEKDKDGVYFPPLTSTTYSAYFASDVTTQESYQKECLIKQHNSQQVSQPGQQSASSGYVTFENLENSSNVSERIDDERESFGSSEGAYRNNMGGLFLQNTSNTITKMPDIISHPPIDGEELERSGLESAICSNFTLMKDMSCTSLQEDSIICDHLQDGTSKSSHQDSTESGDNFSFSSVIGLDNDQSLDRIEGTVSSSENSGISDNLELSQILSAHLNPPTELDIQHNGIKSESAGHHGDEANPTEEPYRMSLQALLKKSQEYRRSQRMLRNQAKNTKMQERTQEQTKARAEEQSLSDKENDEFPYKGTVTDEGKKMKERRGTVIPSVDTPAQKSWGNDTALRETEIKNNKLNISQDVIAEPNQISPAPQQQPTSTETSPNQEVSYLTTCPKAFYNGLGKYNTIPAPNFCMSPVKSKSIIQDGEALNGAETSERNVLVDSGLNESHKVQDLGAKNSPTLVPFTVNITDEGGVTNVSAKSSQHIDQLEYDLSSLKVLISDLASTLSENLESPGLTDSNTRNEFSFNKLRHDEEVEQDQRLGEQPLSLDNLDHVIEDTGSEPCISDTNDVLAKEAVNREERTKQCQEALKNSHGQHGGNRKPTAKCILSVTQRMRIPDVFRNVPSATTSSRNVSVLSDSSNLPAERKNEATAEGYDSHSPSLNQSYDVDAPSCLWLLESSGSDKSHLFQEKSLTPESGGEGQGGGSKVKRRLLMQMTEETRERSAKASRGAGSVIRPNIRSPRDVLPPAAVRSFEGRGGQEAEQEQLKQAHAAQVRALQQEHRRQQEELMQALAERYRLLQSVSFPCSMSSSRPGDTATFSLLSQPGCSLLSERCRPLLAAAVKGFLTRRMLRTERVVQLGRTVRDTLQFLQALQQPSPSSRQDVLLQEKSLCRYQSSHFTTTDTMMTRIHSGRRLLCNSFPFQLRAARYEVHDIFFSLSAGERMQLIGWDRELARERELRRQSGHPRGRSSLSIATQKSLERKRGMMIQKKAAERHKGVVTMSGPSSGLSSEQPPETRRGQFRANPQRVPKSTRSSRPR
ncbi:hypothetical protein F7725_016082 [Dissostichus mawsoni]|uniref:Centriolar coiled-coil protein of 110 kDa n=1 Tax=Dissostichus mawsoni TaxID=36200 RepID=A0A7J5Y3L3_DISMA|nr:hypothetical protein F7725_016082 [Dissostichus mawsoni]